MKIALDPHMHRHLPLGELCRKTAEFRRALSDHGVKLASVLPMDRWASPHEDERQAAVRYWKEAIRATVAMDCDTMNSEFGRGPSPTAATAPAIVAAVAGPSRTSIPRPPGGARSRSWCRSSRRRA